MINLNNIDLNWIEKISKTNKSDKILVEKVIRAFLLLEGLALSNIPFIFKGGTSLMLLTGSSKRLSIDIDIIINKNIDNIFEILKDFAPTQGFIRVETQERNTKTQIPKHHYKLYYNPIHKTAQDEEYILLDVLCGQIPYSTILQKEISSTFIPTITPYNSVNIPSPEDLLGDKLTAFAPNTTGIPYFKKQKSMSMEIIKQLFDIGCLFDICSNIKIIKGTFNRIVETELLYRNKEVIVTDVLYDIFQTSLCISSRGILGKGDFNELQMGINRVKGFIFSESYQIEKAIISASKAAYLSQLIINNANIIEKFKNPLQVKEHVIKKAQYIKLNKLKKNNPEAFFYWYKALEIETPSKSQQVNESMSQ